MMGYLVFINSIFKKYLRKMLRTLIFKKQDYSSTYKTIMIKISLKILYVNKEKEPEGNAPKC